MAFFRAFFKVLAGVFPIRKSACNGMGKAWDGQARDLTQANHQVYEKS
jgi:hypothetical protein